MNVATLLSLLKGQDNDMFTGFWLSIWYPPTCLLHLCSIFLHTNF